MKDIIILDLECLKSPEDCRHCGQTYVEHAIDNGCFTESYDTVYEPIGWDNTPALGLSIGGYYSYRSQRVHWFDEHGLESTVRHLVAEQPLIVSFNGIGFDFVLMRELLENRAEALQETAGYATDEALNVWQICNCFEHMVADSYDILAEIWHAVPKGARGKGLYTLNAIAQANGLGAKIGHGAQAPRDWAAGRHAEVVNYCQQDIYLTKALFELIRANRGWIKRGDGSWLGIRWLQEKEHYNTETGFWEVEGYEWAEPVEGPPNAPESE